MAVSRRKLSNTVGGFTLIEFMVILAVVGILAAITITAYVKARPSARLMEGPSGVKSSEERFEPDMDTAAMETHPVPARSTDDSSPFTLTPATPRATKSPVATSSAVTTGTVTPSPTSEAAPGGEPPQQGPPDSG